MKRILFFILIILAAGCVLLPLLRPGFFLSDDGGWMIIRLSAFYQSLREGQFPVRFLGRLNYGYGYPVANFLYPGFMYLGSFIHLAGFPFTETVKIILGGSVVAAALFTFLWLQTYFPVFPSFIGVLSFVSAPYLLFDLYHRGSVGEVFALPWAAMGLYAIASKKPKLFAPAVALLVLSHNTLALLFLVCFVFYITVQKSWRKFWVMFGLGLGMSAFFSLPAVYERKYVLFNSVAVSDPRNFFVIGGQFIGFAGLASFILSFFNKKIKSERIFFSLVFLVSVYFSLPISGYLWTFRPFAQLIQFPYRFLSISIFAASWLVAYVAAFSKKIITWIVAICILGLAVWQISAAITEVSHTDLPEAFYTTNEATTTVADEYMPKWVRYKATTHAASRLLFYKGRGVIRENRVTTQTVDIEVDAAEDSVIQLNTLYYPGWGATVDDIKVHIDYSNNEDVMRIFVPAGSHHIVVSFRETISRFLADILTLISILVYGVFVVFIRRK